MGVASGIEVIDTMIGFKDPDGGHYVPPGVRSGDGGSEHVADYMFTDVPQTDPAAPAIDRTLAAMDANGVRHGLIATLGDHWQPAVAAHPDRFLLCAHVDPVDPVAAVRSIRALHDAHGLAAVSMFPAGGMPATPVDDARAYPVYAACVELGLPVFVNAGVPGPRVPATSQDVGRFDVVCYDFPELKIVMRHGAEPDEALAVKLMLKWPNLYYSTSAFAPKHYPDAIVRYANTRGAGKIIYGGYFPFALELDRIFAEFEQVGFRDEVWPRFLRDNAASVLGID